MSLRSFAMMRHQLRMLFAHVPSEFVVQHCSKGIAVDDRVISHDDAAAIAIDY